MMESLTREELNCELDYLHFWHSGMCDVISSLQDRVKEAMHSAQADKGRAERDEGKVLQLEEEAKKAKADFDEALSRKEGELSKQKADLAKAVDEAKMMKANYARSLQDNCELGASFEKLKESALKEKDELTVKVQKFEQEVNLLKEAQEKYGEELERESADTYENIMAQACILYPTLNLEGVHYTHGIINGKVVKIGDGPGGFVEVVVPVPMETSPTTKLPDATGQNDSSDARNMDIDPNAEMPPQNDALDVGNVEAKQEENPETQSCP